MPALLVRVHALTTLGSTPLVVLTTTAWHHSDPGRDR